MRRRLRGSARASTRRTTLTLPADSLSHAARIARTRRVNLSTVVSEALSEGLRRHTAAERSEEILRAYSQAFRGFSEEELLILDGVMIERVPRRRR